MARLSGATPGDARAQPRRRVGLWSALAGVLLGLLVVESYLSRRAAT
jgi:hypothetical protein